MEGESAEEGRQQARRGRRSKGRTVDEPRYAGPVRSVAFMVGGFCWV